MGILLFGMALSGCLGSTPDAPPESSGPTTDPTDPPPNPDQDVPPDDNGPDEADRIARCTEAWNATLDVAGPEGTGYADHAVPVVDGAPCNVVRNESEVLHFLNVPSAKQPDEHPHLRIRAVDNGEGYDWLQVDREADTIWMWPAGHTPPIALVPELPRFPEETGKRTDHVYFSAARLPAAAETHAVLLVIELSDPCQPCVALDADLFHLWWTDPNDVATEFIDLSPPGEAALESASITDVVADGSTVYVASNVFTGGAGSYQENQVYATGSGPLGSWKDVQGHAAVASDVDHGGFVSCGPGESDLQAIRVVGDPTDWNLEKAFEYEGALPNGCSVVATEPPVVAATALPLIGAGGDGTPGMGSGPLTVAVRTPDGWEVDELDRPHHHGIDLDVEGRCARLLVPNGNGTSPSEPQDNLEVLGQDAAGEWRKVWGNWGASAAFVRTDGPGMAIRTDGLFNPPWDFQGWAVLEIDPIEPSCVD